MTFEQGLKPEINPEKEARIFFDLDHRKIELTDLQELEKYRVGDKLRLKKDLPLGSVYEELRQAKEIVVIGFDEYGFVVAQLDGGKVSSSSPKDTRRYFKRISQGKKPESLNKKERKKRKIRDIFGREIFITRRIKVGNFRVGDQIRPQALSSYIKDPLASANKLVITHVSESGRAVIQMDDDKYIAIYPKELNMDYEKVE